MKGFSDHQRKGPSHPSHWAINKLVLPPPTTPYPKVTPSSHLLNRFNNKKYQTESPPPSRDGFDNFYNDDQNHEHDYHFRIHRNRAWNSNSPTWVNRPFVSVSSSRKSSSRL